MPILTFTSNQIKIYLNSLNFVFNTLRILYRFQFVTENLYIIQSKSVIFYMLTWLFLTLLVTLNKWLSYEVSNSSLLSCSLKCLDALEFSSWVSYGSPSYPTYDLNWQPRVKSNCRNNTWLTGSWRQRNL